MNTQKDSAQRYFDFRKTQENFINDIKDSQKIKKKSLLNKLKKHKNVSIQRIDRVISASKYLLISDTTVLFDIIVSDLTGKCLDNYVSAKEVINDYINGIFEMHSELAKARKQKSKEFKKFKKEINMNLTMLNHYYNQLKLDIITYRTLNVSADEYKQIIEDSKVIDEVREEYFQEEIKKIDAKRQQNQDEKERKEELKRVQIEAAYSMFGMKQPTPLEETDEFKSIMDLILGLNMDLSKI